MYGVVLRYLWPLDGLCGLNKTHLRFEVVYALQRDICAAHKLLHAKIARSDRHGNAPLGGPGSRGNAVAKLAKQTSGLRASLLPLRTSSVERRRISTDGISRRAKSARSSGSDSSGSNKVISLPQRLTRPVIISCGKKSKLRASGGRRRSPANESLRSADPLSITSTQKTHSTYTRHA